MRMCVCVDYGMPSEKGFSRIRALQLSLVAIASVVIFEGVVGLATNSLAILSDAAHALFDTITMLILLLTTQISLKPPDEEHMYGHGKVEQIGGLIGGVSLVGLAIFLFYEAALRLMSPEQVVQHDIIGFVAVGYTLAVDFFRMGTLWGRGRNSVTLRASFYHALADFASTLIAFIGFGLTFIGGDDRIDATASMVLGLLLVYLTTGLLRTSTAELSDAIPKKIVGEIKKEILATIGVQSCKDLKVRRVGSKTYVETTLSVPSSMDLHEAHDVASHIESSITRLFGDTSVTVHIEPVGTDSSIDKHIESLAAKVEGVKGIHNLSSAYSEGRLYITLHALVDPQLSIEQAHYIAERIEADLAGQIAEIENVTVHIEPYEQRIRRELTIGDAEVGRAIREITKAHPNIRSVKRVVTYVSQQKIHINIDCLFDKETSVEDMHDTVSRVEAEIEKRFGEAIVTIHGEPMP